MKFQSLEIIEINELTNGFVLFVFKLTFNQSFEGWSMTLPFVKINSTAVSIKWKLEAVLRYIKKLSDWLAAVLSVFLRINKYEYYETLIYYIIILNGLVPYLT